MIGAIWTNDQTVHFASYVIMMALLFHPLEITW